MAGTKALFASIGAGAALVAAAALSLLAVSAVLAFGGWSDTATDSVTKPALVFAGSTLPQPAAARSIASAATPIVAPAPPPRQERRREAPPRSARSRAVQPSGPSTRSVAVRDATAQALPAPAQRPTVTERLLPTVRKTGDRVRKAGDSLSTKVQQTGTALADAVQPLAPPVSVAVQQVLNLVAQVVQRTAGALGAGVDTLLAPK